MAAWTRTLAALLVICGGLVAAVGQDTPDPDGPDDDAAQIWDCAAGEVVYSVTAAPDRLEAQVEVTVEDAAFFRDFTIGAVAPFPRFDFSDGADRFYRSADGAFFISEGEAPIACEERMAPPPELDPEGMLDIPGASLGGRLRAGPGTEYAGLGVLSPGAPLTIVRSASVTHEDFAWYEVVLDGTTLYHWGGILCANDYAFEGMAGRCDDVLPEILGDVVFRSRGGNIRSGPGTDFDSVGTIEADTAVTLIANTGIAMQGEPWFEIVFEGASAYHWGGLICADGATEGTAFSRC